MTSPRPGTYVIHHLYEGPNGGRVNHHTDGPAIIGVYPDDHYSLITIWYNHSRHHRLDGPAYTLIEGGVFWTINGDNVTHLRRNSGDGS